MALFLPWQVPLVERSGSTTSTWLGFFRGVLDTLKQAAGVNRFLLADQPTLKAADAGYVGLVTDYWHLVRWTGTVWEFFPGDSGSGYMVLFGVAPQAPCWGLCDGTTYPYLVVGATLTTANFTTPTVADTYFRV